MTRESPPFPLGQTAYEGDSTLIAAAGLNHLKGMEWTFRDEVEDGSGVIATRSGRDRTFRVVKNDTSGTVVAKHVYALDTYGTEATGLASASANGNGGVGPADEHLTTTVADGDLYWTCVKGPATCVTDAGGSIAIADGDMVVVGTSGRVREQDVTETDSDLYEEINSRLGKSCNGSTVSTNDADIIVDIGAK